MQSSLTECEVAQLRASASKACALLKALANEDRLLILCQLTQGERNVGELEKMTGVRQPTLSQQLGIRFLQEALTNIARHADASQVRVRLQHHGAHLRLLVRDNGRGAESPQRPGVGLHSMRERARSLGGDLRIFSHPGAGWALALSMPLEAS
ncbi:hypothetical protein B0D71_04730 [Pseudomonas laurylsulfativorans]|uniref:Histidine kinase domain-containing protein n=2 Tax=Pseudomonas laurylsulfativorans TaxID=1943631 RepID=A0A2S3VW19_9PSED|nr:hypothetical protein B0D71_04730 [Pseudomonas laurylsulfativorans]